MKNDRWKKLSAILDEAEAYGRALGKISFDMQCCAPPEGMEKAGEDMAVLGKRLHALTHSKRYVSLLTELHADPSGLNDEKRRTVELLYRDWVKTKNQSAAFAYERDLAASQGYGRWLEAKKTSDYSVFRDSLARLVDLTRRAVDLRDEKKETYYDSCLDDFEPGGNEKQLDSFFAALSERIVPLTRRILSEGKSVRDTSRKADRNFPVIQAADFFRCCFENCMFSHGNLAVSRNSGLPVSPYGADRGSPEWTAHLFPSCSFMTESKYCRDRIDMASYLSFLSRIRFCPGRSGIGSIIPKVQFIG